MSQDAPSAARSGRVYLDGDQALFAGLVRMEFGPAARIVLFDGDDGRLYAEVEAGPAGHCIQRFDAETCDSVWMGDCENVENPVHVSDFRVVTEADRGCTCRPEVVAAKPKDGRYIGHEASCRLHWKVTV